MKDMIDINCDMGEGMANDAEIMPYISSCNIACGGHAGDEQSMLKTVELAIQHKVKIGAHPSYPDKANFGRQVMRISETDLMASLKQQISMLLEIVTRNNYVVAHIKLHGALYNQTYHDTELAKTICQLIKDIDPSLAVYAPFASAMAKAASAVGLAVHYEAFADRAYNADGSLVSRQNENALLIDPENVIAQVTQISQTNKLTSLDGELVELKADTFCVHSDTPNAIELLKRLNQEFQVA